MALDDHSKHFFGQIAQKAFIEQDGKVLLVQYPPSETHGNGGTWDLPGGRLHDYETAVAGVKREVEEEIGVPVDIHEVLATGVNRVKDDFKLFFVIYKASLKDPARPFTPEAGEIGAIAWHDKKTLFTLPMIYGGYREALKSFLV